MHITTNPYYGIHIAFTGQSEEGKQTFEKLQIKRGGIPHFMLAVLHIHTGMWILYLTRNIIQLHITFWQL